MLERQKARLSAGAAAMLLTLALGASDPAVARDQVRLDPGQQAAVQQAAKAGRQLVIRFDLLTRQSARATKKQINGVRTRVQGVIGGLDDLLKGGALGPGGLPGLCGDWNDSSDDAEALSSSGDFNNDKVVNAADYVVWRETMSGNMDALQAWLLHSHISVAV